jgi:hypothetical protein
VLESSVHLLLHPKLAESLLGGKKVKKERKEKAILLLKKENFALKMGKRKQLKLVF